MNSIRHYAHKELVLDVGYRGFLHRLDQLGVLDVDAREQIVERMIGCISGDQELSLKEVTRLVILMLHARRLGIAFDALRVRPEIHFRSWLYH